VTTPAMVSNIWIRQALTSIANTPWSIHQYLFRLVNILKIGIFENLNHFCIKCRETRRRFFVQTHFLIREYHYPFGCGSGKSAPNDKCGRERSRG